MARDFNENRNVNARLVSAGIDKFGKTFAIQSPYNADGFSSVNVTVEQAPSDIKQYLEGDNSITIYPVPSNVDKLCDYALASFPNIEDLYLFKTSAIVVLEDDLSYLLDLNKIYVPTDLLSAYQSEYPTIASKFDIIVEDYTLTIPFVGDTTLTSEYVDSVIAMLSNAEKNAITKVVIPTDFTQESANAIAWGYDFSAIVNLDNNIWYGATQFDFTEYTIMGSGELTSAIVSNELAKISGKSTLVEKIIVPIDFTSYASGSITAIQNGLHNLRYLETTYEEGAMELDLQGDIVAKITEIGKTLDEALVYAKTIEQQPRNTSYQNNYNVVIIPPIRFTQLIGNQFSGCSNLVYVDKLHITYNTTGRNFYACSNLYQVKYMDFQFPWDGIGETFYNCRKLEKIYIKLLPNEWASGVGYRSWNSFFSLCTKLKEVILEDFEGYDMSVSSSTEFTRQDLVNLLNSIGSPTTQTTLTIGATNIAKLTDEDVAIATAKNWQLA